MPSNFPNHRKESPRKIGTVLTVENFKRVDVIGLLLLLGASILFVTALEEGGTRYSWHSVITLSLLTISLVLWILFLTLEWYQSNHETKQEPVSLGGWLQIDLRQECFSVGMSGAGQFRALGGSIGIAISTNVLNNHITYTLSSILSPIQLNELLQLAEVLTEFPLRLLAITRQAYSDAYNTQMFVLAAFSAATLMATVIFWEKTPRRMTKS
ncbi:hypothetical protein BHYA_0211g00100 [Botrytis hyacinthi]|uniref:Major facilitator superfamily (MFS) profile domain-containing protein n=1 Tax=Botrytis hyacinthi TaxID=278943 RepID=A0A4Z1GB04_9HELO|nr:hypothetical protein BHYA_0211g00100 [Botrytis hyacinthi]